MLLRTTSRARFEPRALAEPTTCARRWKGRRVPRRRRRSRLLRKAELRSSPRLTSSLLLFSRPLQKEDKKKEAWGFREKRRESCPQSASSAYESRSLYSFWARNCGRSSNSAPVFLREESERGGGLEGCWNIRQAAVISRVCLRRGFDWGWRG